MPQSAPQASTFALYLPLQNERLTTLAQLRGLPVGTVIAELTEADAPAVACKAAIGDWQFLGEDPARRYRSEELVDSALGDRLNLRVLHSPLYRGHDETPGSHLHDWASRGGWNGTERQRCRRCGESRMLREEQQ